MERVMPRADGRQEEERLLPRGSFLPSVVRIVPREDYRPSVVRILPRPDYAPPTLPTRALPPGSAVRSVEAEWCPVCLGRQISERVDEDGTALWHCDSCGNEW